MSTILIGSTIPAFKAVEEPDQWASWLDGHRDIASYAHAVDHDVQWGATLQQDARGDEPFAQLLTVLSFIDAIVYRYRFDLGHDRITTGNRFAGICIGRNLIIEHALNDRDIEWIYFADSDISAPPDVLPKLLEVGHKVVGAHVPTYGLGHDKPRMPLKPGDCRMHWNTAGSLLVHRDVFRRVPWRWDPDAGDTDDPATQAEMARLGYPTIVRHDVICRHHPECIGPLEQRGHDLEVYR